MRRRRLNRLRKARNRAKRAFDDAWTGLDMNDWERVIKRLDRKIAKLESKLSA